MDLATLIVALSYPNVEFEKKQNTTLVFLLYYCPQVLKIFYD